MTTFADHFRMIATKPQPDTDDEPVTHFCRGCEDNVQVAQPDDLCPKCVKEQEQGYKVRSLAGRLANGCEADHGTRNHALIGNTSTAVCGAKPGRRSVGWVMPYPERVVTCPRCEKKLARR